MYKVVSQSLAIMLVCLLFLQPRPVEAGRIDLSGEVNPEYKGHVFNSFAISAINAERDFQYWYERIMLELFQKHFNDKLNAIELHDYLGKINFDPNTKPVSTAQLLAELKQKKIEVLILFNVSSQGGKNLADIRNLQDALNATITHKHDPSAIRQYSYAYVTLYEFSTGKIIWQGQGPLRAKVGARKHLKKNAIIQSKRLYKLMLKAGLLPPSYADQLWDRPDEN